MTVRLYRPAIAAALLATLVAAQSSAPPQIPINAPFVATPDPVVSAMLKLAGVKKGDVVYDLGCGDGRIVVAAAKQYSARGVGIDINPDRIEEARARSREAGVEKLVRFEVNDLFDADIHEATVIALYLLPEMNLRLRPKLLKDLKPGTRIVAHTFHMGDWKPEKEQTVEGSRIYLWTIPAK